VKDLLLNRLILVVDSVIPWIYRYLLWKQAFDTGSYEPDALCMLAVS